MQESNSIPPDSSANSCIEICPINPLEASVSRPNNRDDIDTVLKEWFAEHTRVELAFF